MDERPQGPPGAPVVLTGAGRAEGVPCDSRPFLKVRKNRKFMGPQDELAVVAAGEALRAAGLLGRPQGERTGLFLAVGYIPFEQADIDVIMENSVDDGGFSMRRFSTAGYDSANPLLTFRCLSNMPAFHISLNFDIQGPYFVTYPGPGQFYSALDRARAALVSGEVDVAVVGAVAHQRNFLAAHHFGRIARPVDAGLLRDVAGCLVLETEAGAAARSARVRARLREYSVSYLPHDPFEEAPEVKERLEGGRLPDGELGPCALPVALSLGAEGTLRHELETRDGFRLMSAWEAG